MSLTSQSDISTKTDYLSSEEDFTIFIIILVKLFKPKGRAVAVGI
jgi:hypothetical protein